MYKADFFLILFKLTMAYTMYMWIAFPVVSIFHWKDNFKELILTLDAKIRDYSREPVWPVEFVDCFQSDSKSNAWFLLGRSFKLANNTPLVGAWYCTAKSLHLPNSCALETKCGSLLKWKATIEWDTQMKSPVRFWIIGGERVKNRFWKVSWIICCAFWGRKWHRLSSGEW